MKYTEKRKLDAMPFDKYEDGIGFCHSTGFEVLGEDGTWWNEYETPDGDLVYGR